jgi:hypothetical protein
MEMRRSMFGPVQIGIIVLTLATAMIHFALNFMMGKLDILFTLNGLGYLVLLAALFLPLPLVRRYRSLVRIVFIVYTLVTIAMWAAFGMRDVLGYTTKAIEMALVALLVVDRSRV